MQTQSEGWSVSVLSIAEEIEDEEVIEIISCALWSASHVVGKVV